MKLTPVLLPGDAAAILESELPLFDAIERAETPEARAEALAHARNWVVQLAAQLRNADPRTPKSPPQQPQAQPSAAPPPPKPCGCKDGAAQPSAAATLGERVARELLTRLDRVRVRVRPRPRT